MIGMDVKAWTDLQREMQALTIQLETTAQDFRYALDTLDKTLTAMERDLLTMKRRLGL